MTSVDIGVKETGTTPVGHSLQRVGTGSYAADFSWAAPSVESPGEINSGQTFVQLVPEPASAACWSGLILGLAITRRRRK